MFTYISLAKHIENNQCSRFPRYAARLFTSKIKAIIKNTKKRLSGSLQPLRGPVPALATRWRWRIRNSSQSPKQRLQGKGKDIADDLTLCSLSWQRKDEAISLTML
jgi:hypothetical protein